MSTTVTKLQVPCKYPRHANDLSVTVDTMCIILKLITLFLAPQWRLLKLEIKTTLGPPLSL